MKTNLSSRFAPAAVAALLSLPAAAWAQSSQSPATQPATPPAPAAVASPMANHPVAGRNAEERVENRIKELHAQLGITSAEEPQWNQFAEAMRDNARAMDQAFRERAQGFESMNAVQNMQSYEKLAQAHAQDLESWFRRSRSSMTRCLISRSSSRTKCFVPTRSSMRNGAQRITAAAGKGT